MDRHESSLKREAKLYFVRHLEALIESASWVKGKRDGLRLVIGMLVTDESGRNGHLTHLFSQHPSDQKRVWVASVMLWSSIHCSLHWMTWSEGRWR